MFESAANLRSAADEYDWTLPPCCTISLVSNKFFAYVLESKTIITIDGDDGEIAELGWTTEELLTKYAEVWAAQLDG